MQPIAEFDGMLIFCKERHGAISSYGAVRKCDWPHAKNGQNSHLKTRWSEGGRYRRFHKRAFLQKCAKACKTGNEPDATAKRVSGRRRGPRRVFMEFL